MAALHLRNIVTAPELDQFLVDNVQLTGVNLGAGAYGSVEEVEIPGARVAAKKLHSRLVHLGSPEQVCKWVTDFVEECKLMSQLRHPHIVQFLGVCTLPGSQLPVLLMEKLLTSLDNLLETNPNIPLDVKVYLLTGIAQGIVYLHSHTPPIAHRDLTARNILIDSGLIAKIADLGVAKMVNIQPGQLAATMTAGPGNHLYMPPEAVNEEEATRYNTSIDIFSFGVVSLFTVTQIFPKDLKPHNYRDPKTRKIVGRSEIERRDQYIQAMQVALGEMHPIVKLTLDCLEYEPEDRPSAVDVLRRLKEVGRTIPQICAETKLELIRQISVKDKEIKHIQEEHQRQLSNKDAQIHLLHSSIGELQEASECLKADFQNEIDMLQASNEGLRAEKQEQTRVITLQQERLEVQCREIEQLLSQLRAQELQPQEENAHRPQLECGLRSVPASSRKHSSDAIQLSKLQPPRTRMLNTDRSSHHAEEAVSNQARSEADIKQKDTVSPDQVGGDEARNNTKKVECFVTNMTGLHWLATSYTLSIPLSFKVGALYSAVAKHSWYVEDTFTLMWRPRQSRAENEVPIVPNSTATLYEIGMKPMPSKMHLYIKDKDGVPIYKSL